MNKILKFLFLLIIPLFLTGCSARKRSVFFEEGSPYTGKMTIIPIGQSVPEGYTMVGTASYGDTGFSTDCSYEAELQDAIIEARKHGASLVYVQSLKTPDAWSTCYRTTFAFYK